MGCQQVVHQMALYNSGEWNMIIYPDLVGGDWKIFWKKKRLGIVCPTDFYIFQRVETTNQRYCSWNSEFEDTANYVFQGTGMIWPVKDRDGVMVSGAKSLRDGSMVGESFSLSVSMGLYTLTR